jgi:hypothetical protein
MRTGISRVQNGDIHDKKVSVYLTQTVKSTNFATAGRVAQTGQ